jgi:hypothetical protein
MHFSLQRTARSSGLQHKSKFAIEHFLELEFALENIKYYSDLQQS